MGAPIDSMLWKIPLGLLLVSAIIALPSALASPIASAIGSDDIVPEKGIQPVEFATKILGLEGLVTKVQKDHRASKAQPDSARDHKHEARNAVHDHKHEARNAVQSSLSSSLLELDKPDTWTCGYYERTSADTENPSSAVMTGWNTSAHRPIKKAVETFTAHASNRIMLFHQTPSRVLLASVAIASQLTRIRSGASPQCVQ